jgi:hypothetical protein
MYVVYGVLVTAMLFMRMKLCVLCGLALVLAVSVTTTRVAEPRVASLMR